MYACHVHSLKLEVCLSLGHYVNNKRPAQIEHYTFRLLRLFDYKQMFPRSRVRSTCIYIVVLRLDNKLILFLNNFKKSYNNYNKVK